MQDVSGFTQTANLIKYISLTFDAFWRRPAYPRLNLNITL